MKRGKLSQGERSTVLYQHKVREEDKASADLTPRGRKARIGDVLGLPLDILEDPQTCGPPRTEESLCGPIRIQIHDARCCAEPNRGLRLAPTEDIRTFQHKVMAVGSPTFKDNEVPLTNTYLES